MTNEDKVLVQVQVPKDLLRKIEVLKGISCEESRPEMIIRYLRLGFLYDCARWEKADGVIYLSLLNGWAKEEMEALGMDVKV